MKNEKLKIKIKKDISLARYTTFKIGGRARYFLIAKSREDIIGGIQWAKKKKLPFFVLGGGSNLLVSDKGYNGLVVQTKSQKSKVKITSQKSEVFEVDAGMPLKSFIKLSMEQGLSGLEWAVGIPGITVGGAIRGNAGAFGSRMSDVVKEVEVIEIKNLKLKTLKNKDSKFNCKDSVFKKNRTLVILSAVLVLKKKNKQEVKKEVERILRYRKLNHPVQPSAGCVFKNVSLQGKKNLIAKFNNFPVFENFKKSGEIPAGWLIEQVGLKGKRIGGAEISAKHCNFIVNTGKAKAKDIVALINLAKKQVKSKFNIKLEEEIQYLGF